MIEVRGGEHDAGRPQPRYVFARALHLPEKDAREQAIVIEAVRRWLEGHGRWLLVYDNAEDPKVVRDALPRAPTGHVLITSRNPAWGTIAQALPLDRWIFATASLCERGEFVLNWFDPAATVSI